MEADFLQSYDFEQIRNVTHRTVRTLLQEELNYLENDDICLCQQCVLDMVCYALCHAPARYEVSLLPNLHGDHYRYQEEVRQVIRKAIETVALFPNH